MNKISRTCCGLLLLLAGCNTLPIVPTFLNASTLPSQLLQINTERDTTITLNGGTILTIPARALHIDGSTIAKLEVKEALTIEQMLAAGLRTQGNEEPLSSGGMIYINTADNSKLNFNQPIKIQVPTHEIVEGMELFKGEVKESGINWTDPKPLPPQERKNKIDGKALFMQNCASCHSVGNQVTGPALFNVMERWKYDTASVNAFIRNSGQVIASGHCYAVHLFNAYNKQVMPGFPSFTNEDMEGIYEYIDNESRKHPEYKDKNASAFQADSCAYYNAIVQLAAGLQDGDENNDFTNVNYLPTVTDTDDTDITYDIPGPVWNDIVIPEYKPREYYNFTINATGWYNIDIFMTNLPGFTTCQLSVTINEKSDQNVSVFLLVPSEKIMLQGGLLNDGKSYGFFERNSDIPLPLGAEAFVVSFAENTGKKQLYFGSKRFIIEQKQVIDINIKPTDEKKIYEQIQRLRLPDFELKINKLNLTAEQKKLTKEADRVKTQAALCNCMNKTNIPAK